MSNLKRFYFSEKFIENAKRVETSVNDSEYKITTPQGDIFKYRFKLDSSLYIKVEVTVSDATIHLETIRHYTDEQIIRQFVEAIEQRSFEERNSQKVEERSFLNALIETYSHYE